ncbi:hypothetical protein EKK58_11050 [Candidatus Dependentiae bacterium]|nr:MAG: hypothetical protein EKK58_11050 [Candidatus Dependentiae bacterium]
MTNVSAVTNHFPSAEEGFTTTLSSTISAGATTVGVNSLSGYTTGEVATFIVAPTVASEKQVFTGVVDTAGLQLTNVVWTTGTNQTHAAGTTVVDYVTATHQSQTSKGILVQHNQDGTHGAVTATSVASSGAVSGTTGTFTSNITEKGATLATMRDELGYDYVASGGIWSGDAYGSTRNASMTALVCYINGKRVSASAVTARAFTASKDTYVDVDDSGTISYTEVANNAASPSLSANSIRIAIVVSGGSSIASAYSINQGRVSTNTNNLYLPTAISGTPSPGCSDIQDSNGILIHPTDPLRKLVCSRSRAAANNTGAPGGTSVAWNGMSGLVFQAEPNTNYLFHMNEPALSGYSTAGVMIWELYLATAANTYTTTVNEESKVLNLNDGVNFQIPFNSGSYSGKTFLNIKIRSAVLAGTTSMNTDTTRTGVYQIKKA